MVRIAVAARDAAAAPDHLLDRHHVAGCEKGDLLADLDDLQVELDISQTDFNRISTQQECRMTPEAYPDRDYRCEIDEISPEANRQKASIEVKVKVLEPDEFLRPEMSARVTFLRKEEEQSDE